MNWNKALPLLFFVLLGTCLSQSAPAPSIDFIKIPKAAPGDPNKFTSIKGRANGARPGQQIVLYAKSQKWYVQPYANQPFTKIQSDSTWECSIHPGTDYAALLVEPGYAPAPILNEIPAAGNGIVLISVTKGEPEFWQTWWFMLLCMLAALIAAFFLYRLRMRQLTHQLNLRYEERLSERTRIAQDLHDTLLQGFLSASMQLHVAAEQLPEDSPAKPQLDRVLELMRQVIEEGRNAVRGLRPSQGNSHDLEEAFAHIQEELGISDPVEFRIIVEGQSGPLHPVIRDEVYRIGREALVNSFRHAKASKIEVELESTAAHLRVLVRDNGCGIDPQVLKTGRDGHWGLSGMRERADRIGAGLRVWSSASAGTEIELSVPGNIAFQNIGKKEIVKKVS